MDITRRTALWGAAAVAATGAVPIAVLASTNDVNADAALLARVAQWHRAYEKVLEAGLFQEAYTGRTLDEYYARGYGPASGRLWAIQKELIEAQPKTLAGAVALLGCAERNAEDIDRLRVGEQVPQAVFFVHASLLSKTAYAALRRLVATTSI